MKRLGCALKMNSYVGWVEAGLTLCDLQIISGGYVIALEERLHEEADGSCNTH